MSIEKNYEITLDLREEKHENILKFDDEDINVNSVKMFIENGGEKVDIEGIQGTLYIQKPNRKVLRILCENQGKYFYINLPEEFTDLEGMYTGQLALVKGNKRVISDTFKYEVK